MKTSLSIILLLIYGINANTQTPDWLWAKSAGGIYGGYLGTICTDVNDNVYITGSFEDPFIVFGNDTLMNYHDSAGAMNMFVVKYDPTGNVLWANTSAGSSYNGGTGVCADANGNVYITGWFYTPLIVFGTDTLTSTVNNENFFIIKYDASGNLVWVNGFKGTGQSYNVADGIAADAGGNIYVTGSFGSTTIIFGPDTLTSDSSQNVFVAKYDSTGNAIWGKSMSSAGGISGSNAISTDEESKIYITGFFASPKLTLGNIILTNTGYLKSTGYANIFMAKYDSSGNVIWANSAGGTGYDYGTGITADAQGNVYIAGDFTSNKITIGNDTLANADTSGDNFNVFIAKYNASGNPVWAKSVQGDLNYLVDGCLSLDVSGHVYLAGDYYNAKLIFGNDTVLNINTGDSVANVFIAEYDTSGNILSAQSIGGTGSAEISDLSIDKSDNIFINGRFSNTLVLGNDTLKGLATRKGFTKDYTIDYTSGDIFVAKYETTSTGITNTPITTNSITVSPNPSTGQFYFKGITQGSTLEIYDMIGQTIYSSTVTGDNYLLNLTGQARGMYFYRVIDKSANVQEGKIIVE